MRYRIKDEKQRKLIKQLFDIEEINSGHTSTELRVDLSFDDINFASNYLPVEKVQELAEGWNPYPRVKPQKEGQYYCVHRHSPSDNIIHSVITFHGKRFVDWNNLIFGWRELPEVWKEMEK